MIATSCEHCVFRDGLKCHLGLVEKYDDLGQLAQLDGRDFHVVNRVCLSRRTKQWAEDVDNTNWAIYEEYEVPITYIVIFDGDFDGLAKTLGSIVEQFERPSKERVILSFKSGFDITRCREAMEVLEHSNYFLSALMEEPEDELGHVDAVFNKCHNGYYIVAKSGDELNNLMYHELVNLIFYEVEQVSVIKPRTGITGLCVFAPMHKWMMGNRGGSLMDKLDTFDEFKNMVFTWSDDEDASN